MSEDVPKNVLADLKPKQRAVVDTLVAGGDKESAAAAAGVTVRTVNRYLEEPAVRAALDKGIGTAVGDVARRMIGAMDTAVDVMVNILEDGDVSAAIKLRAAVAIIEHGPNLLGSHDLLQRIAKLEALLIEQQR